MSRPPIRRDLRRHEQTAAAPLLPAAEESWQHGGAQPAPRTLHGCNEPGGFAGSDDSGPAFLRNVFPPAPHPEAPRDCPGKQRVHGPG